MCNYSSKQDKVFSSYLLSKVKSNSNSFQIIPQLTQKERAELKKKKAVIEQKHTKVQGQPDRRMLNAVCLPGY